MQRGGDGEQLDVIFIEENGIIELLWSLDDSYVSDLDGDEWHHGQIDVKNINKDLNYQVSYGSGFLNKFCGLDFIKNLNFRSQRVKINSEHWVYKYFTSKIILKKSKV